MWTPPAANTPPLTVRRLSIPEECLSRTIAEEVWYLVREWYRVRGIPVPPSEEKECLEAIAAKDNPLPSEPVADLPPSKPVYGTPEFWKAWWAKKKAKEAAAAAAAASGGSTPEVEVVAKPVKKTTKKKDVAV